MEDINVPRSLYYKEKSDFHDFISPKSKKCLESQYLKALKKRPFIKGRVDKPDYILKIFNNANYICTLIYFESEPALYIGRYKNIAANYQKNTFWEEHMMPATMALVYNWVNTSWFRKEKDMEDGALEALDEFLVDLYDEFRNWDVIGIQEGKDDFYTLLLEKDIYEPSLMKDNYIGCRPIDEVIEDQNIPVQDLADGIDYILVCLWNEKQNDYYVLMKTLNRLEIDVKQIKDYHQWEYATSKVRNRLRELGHWIEGEENRDYSISKNSANEEESFLNQHIRELENELEVCREKSNHIDAGPAAALFLAIAQITDSETLNKEKLALAVSKIFGWKVNDDGKGHVRNHMVGSKGITHKHIEEIAKIIEEAMPNLAVEIRKLKKVYGDSK